MSSNSSSQFNQTFPPVVTFFPPAGWFARPPAGWFARPPPPSNDINSRILVTAVFSLVFVIALVVALHLYARHALRGRHSTSDSAAGWSSVFVFRSTAPPEQQQLRQGLDPAAVARIPKYSYKLPAGDQGVAPADCSICLSAVDEGEAVRALPRCKHVLHVDCVDMWLHSHATCPVCRSSAEPPAEGDEGSSSSMTSKLSSSFRRIMSARERSGTGRRVHSEEAAMEDLERQQNGASSDQ